MCSISLYSLRTTRRIRTRPKIALAHECNRFLALGASVASRALFAIRRNDGTYLPRCLYQTFLCDGGFSGSHVYYGKCPSKMVLIFFLNFFFMYASKFASFPFFVQLFEAETRRKIRKEPALLFEFRSPGKDEDEVTTFWQF
jgi:hypothetical protein